MQRRNSEKLLTCFLRFKVIKIQNGHCLNVQMKRAQNSDSKTYVKK